ncbi:RIKEN cDNA 9930022D16 [Mus musculus]|nr:RIKEN cDNA 9930022D16 [Mus musculus]
MQMTEGEVFSILSSTPAAPFKAQPRALLSKTPEVSQSILMSSFGNQDTRRTIVSSSFEMSHQGSGRAQLEHKPISHRSCGLSVLRRESQEHRERRWLTPHRVPTQPNHRGSAPHSLRAFVGSWLAGWSLGTTVTQKTQRHSVKWQSKLCQQRI